MKLHIISYNIYIASIIFDIYIYFYFMFFKTFIYIYELQVLKIVLHITL